MENALISAGIIPQKEYVGLVDFYDPIFDGVKGRGRIIAYLGKGYKAEYPFKTLEVFEEGITKGLWKHNDKFTLKEFELVRFKITISKYGFTATEVYAMCMSSGLVDWREFLPRVDSNKTYYEPMLKTGLGARVRTAPRMTMMHQATPCDYYPGNLLTDGNYKDYSNEVEELPKIKRISQEENNEQEK